MAHVTTVVPQALTILTNHAQVVHLDALHVHRTQTALCVQLASTYSRVCVTMIVPQHRTRPLVTNAKRVLHHARTVTAQHVHRAHCHTAHTTTTVNATKHALTVLLPLLSLNANHVNQCVECAVDLTLALHATMGLTCTTAIALDRVPPPHTSLLLLHHLLLALVQFVRIVALIALVLTLALTAQYLNHSCTVVYVTETAPMAHTVSLVLHAQAAHLHAHTATHRHCVLRASLTHACMKICVTHTRVVVPLVLSLILLLLAQHANQSAQNARDLQHATHAKTTSTCTMESAMTSVPLPHLI